MIVILNNQSLIVRLTADKTASPPLECHCFVSYRGTTDSTYEFLNNSVYTDGTNNQTLVAGNASFGSSDEKAVDEISIYNPDSITVTVEVVYNDGSFEYILVRQALTANQNLSYNDKYGWHKI